MSSNLVKIGAGLSYLNTAWLTGLSLWLWSLLPGYSKSIEEMEEVIIEMEDEMKAVEELKDDVNGLQLSLDSVEERVTSIEKRMEKQNKQESEQKTIISFIIKELEDMGVDISSFRQPFTPSSPYVFGDSYSSPKHQSEMFTTTRGGRGGGSRGARGGRGGRRGGRGGGNLGGSNTGEARDEIDDDIESLRSQSDY